MTDYIRESALRLLQRVTTILQSEFGSAATALNWSIQYDGSHSRPWSLLFLANANSGAEDLLLREITATCIVDALQVRSDVLECLDGDLPAYSAWWAKDRDADWGGFVCMQRMRGGA